MNRVIFLVTIAFVLCAALPRTARAQDYYLEEYLFTSAPMEQSTANGTIKTWIKGDKMRKNSFDRDTMIFRPDKGVAWMVHEKSKTYVEVPLEQLRALTEQNLGIYSPPTDPNTGKPGPWFKKTGRTEKMGKWNCYEIELLTREIIAPGITTRTTQWISKDVGAGSELTVRMFKISLGANISPTVQKLLDAVKALDGATVQQETVTEAQGQTVKTTLTLKKIEKKTLEDSLFEIPTGYTKITPPPVAGMKP